ncbi:MAG: hypothetical protein J6S77_04300 [Clostridia bacterium]|nr:hypothetical protein [Clostridia bacterium]
MKFSKRLFFRSALSLLLAVCILAGGLMLMGMTETEDKAVDTDSYAPDVSDLIPEEESIITDTTVPTPQEQLSGKFGQYLFTSELEGKSVVSIYSAEQISDFVARRENGEWFSLSAEDMLFIIDDTVKLFKTYDLVVITDLEGNTVAYPGVKFYSSQEYKDCFNGLEFGTNEYSFDIEKDIWQVIKTRAIVLNSASYDNRNGFCVFTDIETPVTEKELWYVNDFAISYYFHDMTNHFETYRGLYEETLAPYGIGMFYFGSGSSIEYVEQLNCKDNTAEVKLYSDGFIPAELDFPKYDTNGKSVVIEVWDMKAEQMVARLRLEGYTDAKEVSDLEALWEEFKNYTYLGTDNGYERVPVEDYDAVSDYRVAVFFNGFEGHHGFKEVVSIRFGADAYQNYCQFHFGGGFDEISEPHQLSGSQAISEYVNTILKDRLTQD